MPLYERLIGTELPHIAVHALSGLQGELERGKLTAQQVVDALGLSAEETTEAAALLAQIVPPRESISIGGGAITLSNVGTAYDTTVASQGLGWSLVQAAGITQVVFSVMVQKVGNGTQSWQLWNETNGTEVALITDAAAAGARKVLSITVNFDPALAPGMKVIRVRAQSTTAADDPVYFGSSISIRRANVLTAVELHEVLLCCRIPNSPYPTVAALKARLGVV